LIVLFFSLGLGERNAHSPRLNKPPTIIKGLKRRLSAMDHSIEAQSSPGSSLICLNNTISSCSINGTSSVTLPAGQNQTFTNRLGCPWTQVYVSWNTVPGLSISMTIENGDPVVTASASTSASGQGSVWTEWCDNENKHAVYQTLISIPSLGCDEVNCTASQWCFQDNTGTGNCLNFVAEGQFCGGLAKCLPGLYCFAQNCTKPRMPCLYNPISNCTLNVTDVTSFVPNGQNNTLTITLPSTNPECGPALYSSFSANYTFGVQLYYEVKTSEIQITVNDLIKGSGIITVEFCDQSFRYLTRDLTFDFFKK